MNYRVSIAREAEKILELDLPTERRIRRRLIRLAEDPFDPRLCAPPTERHGLRKSRVGGWRIIFAVDRETKVVSVLTIDTRGQVYKHS